ncbi:helix-turn-helix domain-containing protein [Niabella yanshanensis]|uniref:Helix-turn-helix domain-containing protein n=1 Tax=Niabella yanshanensis TaxID=577386 RepID=A0ABZ0W3V9_9BACT|nr:helix-turn-helix domain-containing protein [Niabella yanshanensis]WQD37629.1 helix-turn-helix domain-containing protein [Niabella yanshanensis]
MSILFLTGIIITFFLSSLLITKRGKTKADYILTTWLFVLGIHLSLFYMVQTQQYQDWPYLLGLEIPLPLVHGPLLFLYTTALTNQFPGKNYWIFHFIPVLFVYILLTGFLSRSATDKIWVYQNEGEGYEQAARWIFAGIILSGLSYIGVSLYYLKRHRRNILNVFADTEKINLNWLYYLIIGITVIWVVVIWGDDSLIYTVVVFFILFIGYFGIKQVGILNNAMFVTSIPPNDNEAVFLPRDLATQPEPEVVKYQKSRLTKSAIEKIHRALLELMQKERLFTDVELTLGALSGRLAVHPNTLSQVINSAEGKNFYDYINALRVEAFIKALNNPENKKYTLLSLAFECGFNSKASFNRNFKKHIGVSPTAYLKNTAMTIE